MPRLVSALIVVWCALLAPEARAWNDYGHWLVARIAYDQLTDDERVKIHEILKKHPHYERYLIADNLDGASPAEWSIMRSASWSDYVRGSRNDSDKDLLPYHHGFWHYVDYPISLSAIAGKLPPEPLPVDGEVLKQIERSRKVLLNGEKDPDKLDSLTDEQNRAVRVCWLMHLVGDMHQPLHVSSLVDEKRFTNATHNDNGGNLVIVRREIVNRPEKLHAVWDQMLGADAYYPAVIRAARRLTSDPDLKPAALTDLDQHPDLLQWAEESYIACEKYVYRFRGEELKTEVWHDNPKDRATETAVPLLPRGYLSIGQEVAEKRACLAGYRLARLLKQIAAQPTKSP